MRAFHERLRNFFALDDGPTAVEYAVLLMLIIGICVAVVRTQGTLASSTFGSIEGGVSGAGGAGGSASTPGAPTGPAPGPPPPPPPPPR